MVMFDFIVWASPSCEEREASEKFKMKIMSPAGFEPTTLTIRIESWCLRPLGYAGRQ